MATASVATAGAGTVTYADGETLSYAVAGQYMVAFAPGKVERDIRPVPAPGEDNQGTQDFGLRSFEFSMECIYVIGSDATYATTVKADLLTMANVSTITIDTDVFAGCKMVSSESSPAKQTGFGTVRGTLKLSFISYQPS